MFFVQMEAGFMETEQTLNRSSIYAGAFITPEAMMHPPVSGFPCFQKYF